MFIMSWKPKIDVPQYLFIHVLSIIASQYYCMHALPYQLFLSEGRRERDCFYVFMYLSINIKCQAEKILMNQQYVLLVTISGFFFFNNLHYCIVLYSLYHRSSVSEIHKYKESIKHGNCYRVLHLISMN